MVVISKFLCRERRESRDALSLTVIILGTLVTRDRRRDSFRPSFVRRGVLSPVSMTAVTETRTLSTEWGQLRWLLKHIHMHSLVLPTVHQISHKSSSFSAHNTIFHKDFTVTRCNSMKSVTGLPSIFNIHTRGNRTVVLRAKFLISSSFYDYA